MATGPGISRNSGFSAHIIDCAPTILAMLRLPLGRDMEGRVLEELFSDRFRVELQPRAVKTHTTRDFRLSRRSLAKRHQDETHRIEQLQSLGYIPDD